MAAMIMAALPQTMAQVGKGQVANSAGGFSFEVTDQQRLARFLILGSESGTYYTRPVKHTAENLSALLRLISSGCGPEAVAIIKDISVQGRAPKQTPTLSALSICCQLGDAATKSAAYEALPAICRIPTHLFEFLECSEAAAKTLPNGPSGWGRKHRRAIAAWYNGRSPTSLAEAVTKYQKRNGWAHLDALRLCHAAPTSPAHGTVFAYIAKGLAAAEATADPATPPRSAQGKRATPSDSQDTAAVLEYLNAVEQAKALTCEAEGEQQMVELIKGCRLRREHVPSCLLNSATVWTALLEGMPLTALMRSLSKLSAIGVVAPNTPVARSVAARLADADALMKARVHPMAVLFAHRTYASGHGEKGSLSWDPVPEVTKALDDAFHMAFTAVVPAGKRFLLALDVSGSMSFTQIGGGGGSSMSCHEASAAMALVTLKTEPECETMCFSDTFQPLPLHKNMTLQQATEATSGLPFGGTDCSLPMQWAHQHGKLFDVFVVFTDSETYQGRIHADEALRRYRHNSGIRESKLVVVGMASNGFTIADPSDPGMLDVVGFDSAAPEIISAFAAGRV